MCAIVDANVANAAVSQQANEASKEFLRHVSTGALKIVVGGYRLHDELQKCSGLFQRWFSRARYAGHIVDVDNELVDQRSRSLEESGKCVSNDSHLVALAELTGARLVFTNDRDLQRDCKSILRPQASIYTTNDERTDFTSDKRRLLESAVCPGYRL